MASTGCRRGSVAVFLPSIALGALGARAPKGRQQLGAAPRLSPLRGWDICQLDAKFPPSLYVKNPPPLVEPALPGAGSLQAPSVPDVCWVGGGGWPKATSPMSVLSPSPPRRRGGRRAVGNAQRFPRGVGGCREGEGGGSLPCPVRPPAGVMGVPGEEGALSTEGLRKTPYDDRPALGGFTTPPPAQAGSSVGEAGGSAAV
jgi:hypothetical protein